MQLKYKRLIAAFTFIWTMALSSYLVAQQRDRLQTIFDKLREEQPPSWTYSELTEKSDVIVVAKLESKSTVESDVKVAGKFADKSTSLVKNTVEVLATLKGEVDNKIDIYTLKWKNVLVLTNSDFAELRKKQLMPLNVPVVIDDEITGYAEILGQGDKTHTIEPEYLLFLKKIANNKYVPTTGQRYSGVSVKRLNQHNR